MAHMVESLFYSGREVPWHGLGTQVAEAPTSAEAIKLAGLDWNVESKPIFTEGGVKIAGYKANVRDSDNSVLGVVTDRYQIVQNSEAFAFTDALLGEGCRYETAGSLRNGKQIWLLAKMPEKRILEDKFDPYICFTNTFDGSGAVRCCMTPVRVVCNNTLNFALQGAQRSWSTRHIGDITNKLAEAEYTLGLANKYMEQLSNTAEQLANTKLTDEQMMKALDEMFPLEEGATERRKKNVSDMKDGIIACVYSPDLMKFVNTAWGFVNAVSDYATHSAPSRNTANYVENNFLRVLNGHPMIDSAFAKV